MPALPFHSSPGRQAIQRSHGNDAGGRVRGVAAGGKSCCIPAASRPLASALAQVGGGQASQRNDDEEKRQEQLWHRFFQDPSDWWDNRPDKRGPTHPDFRHKTSREPLWLNSARKPAWVDAQLAGLDVLVRGPRASPALDPMFHSLSKCCEEAELNAAVEALDTLVQRGCHVPDTLFYRVLRRCIAEKDLVCGERVHVLALQCGYGSNAFLANHSIGMFSSHGRLDDAVQAFSRVPVPSIHMWASIILAHVRQGQHAQAINLYLQLRASGAKPNNHVFVAVLKACASAQDLVSGKEVHVDIQASAEKADLFVMNGLVNMYAKCGCLNEAREVFESMPTRDVVTWTALIDGYTQQGLGTEALALYARMQQEGIGPANRVTFVCLLQACAAVGALQQGKQLHSQIRQRGLEADVVIGNCLVNMYAKCGSLEDARKVFDTFPKRDAEMWTTMVALYTQQELGREALSLYASMQQEGISPLDSFTLGCLLRACTSVGALQQGKQLARQIQQAGLEDDELLGSCLVDMYSKCGSLEEARKVFDRMATQNLVTWTAMLNGYAEHGDGHMAIQCFEEMLQQGIRPDDTSFTCLFVACSHAGLVREGLQYFRMMVEEYGITPTEYHYSCMVDLLGRSGYLDEAENILQTLSFMNVAVGWKALLSACKSHGDVKRGHRCFDHLVELEPENASAYVLLGNIYAKAGWWDAVDTIENLRKAAGAVKKPAKACIEVKNEVHEFTVGEKRADILRTLTSMNSRLKDEGGHVPQTELVLRSVSEQEKEDALCGHAEKLALAYGLLSTPDGTTLVVTKNLRMCNDCHSSTKIMSRLENREIVVRDSHRVHRFLDGSCSCRDRC